MTPEPPAAVMISHAPSCPVAQPGFIAHTDRAEPCRCTCDFAERLKAAIDPSDDVYRDTYRSLTRDAELPVVEWHELPEIERSKWRTFLDGAFL